MVADVSELEVWYGLADFPDNYFDFCLDIGARHGEIAEIMLRRNPQAQVICYEACKSNFEILAQNLSHHDNVVCVNRPLGNGGDLYFSDLGFDDCHMFVPKNTGGYKIKSVTLRDIFKFHQVRGRVQITIDIEGGEWCLLDDSETLQSCDSIGMELHFKPTNPNRNLRFQNLPEWAVFQNWVDNTFNMHRAIYLHSRREFGTGIYKISKIIPTCREKTVPEESQSKGITS